MQIQHGKILLETSSEVLRGQLNTFLPITVQDTIDSDRLGTLEIAINQPEINSLVFDFPHLQINASGTLHIRGDSVLFAAKVSIQSETITTLLSSRAFGIKLKTLDIVILELEEAEWRRISIPKQVIQGLLNLTEGKIKNQLQQGLQRLAQLDYVEETLNRHLETLNASIGMPLKAKLELERMIGERQVLRIFMQALLTEEGAESRVAHGADGAYCACSWDDVNEIIHRLLPTLISHYSILENIGLSSLKVHHRDGLLVNEVILDNRYIKGLIIKLKMSYNQRLQMCSLESTDLLPVSGTGTFSKFMIRSAGPFLRRKIERFFPVDVASLLRLLIVQIQEKTSDAPVQIYPDEWRIASLEWDDVGMSCAIEGDLRVVLTSD
ncbi:MAG: hypothetical protein KTR24_06220 [Saprospiraceae bacterium]|nr:hypothetical protein [Saprospiraceae bacterium]